MFPQRDQRNPPGSGDTAHAVENSKGPKLEQLLAQVLPAAEDRQSLLGDAALGDSANVAPPSRDHHRAWYGVRYRHACDHARLYGVH